MDPAYVFNLYFDRCSYRVSIARVRELHVRYFCRALTVAERFKRRLKGIISPELN